MRPVAILIRRLTLFVTVACLVSCGGSPTASTASSVVVLNASNFEDGVVRSGRPFMVEFYSPTCPHCQRMEPIVEQLANDYAGRASVGKINVDVERELVVSWQITGWPTFLFFRNGQEVSRVVGTTTYEHLAGMLNAAIGG